MNTILPDVSLTDEAARPGPLAWVGMQGIDLPVTVAERNYRREVDARVDMHVDLPAPHAKGIHMSRLYRLLDELDASVPLSPSAVAALPQAMLDSHRDCGSGRARLRLGFDLLVRRRALVTEGLAGWKRYPVRVETALIDGARHCRLQVVVGYSSTCPCSAALSRHLVAQCFIDEFASQQSLDAATVSAWLRDHATLATPHSQRSEAQVAVDVDCGADSFEIMGLIDSVEHALETPLQTAVKRADEQAFAALNGQNLMFVEDAARRIQTRLDDYIGTHVHVRHLESLHPHDAVAWTAAPRSAQFDGSY
ncbi:GTP cyclohydrolase FolE2 [Chitinasiproducens palmae]|uniref:GTP cyclohydrolase FolE2 n=1 Tax=Chitinasiproducens palmae TaxID=1770053 RepID=A0A1H2PKH3_9BURK|nr:GTP cyclohydrolase FolE2 [Chitinasiproducens palmae]SDV46442.1 GTP cyclohydrolase I [Chitinasiproducens palmae]